MPSVTREFSQVWQHIPDNVIRVTLTWAQKWHTEMTGDMTNEECEVQFFMDTAQMQVSSARRAPCLPVCSGSESGTFWCLGSLNRTAGVTTSQTMMSTVTETGTQMNDCTANKSHSSLHTLLVWMVKLRDTGIISGEAALRITGISVSY